MKIYFKEPIVNNTLEVFFEDFFKALVGKETFYDKECKKLQYGRGKRSLDDLLSISNTYFENITDIDILKALCNINNSFYINYCFIPHKPVIKMLNDSQTFSYDLTAKKFPKSVKKVKNFFLYVYEDYSRLGRSKYSVKKIEELLSSL